MNDSARGILIAIVVVLAVPLLWGGMMMGGMGPWMMAGWDGDARWDTGRWLLMMVPGLLFFGVLVAALVWAIGRFSPASESGGSAAREILDARYARGEITREQYEQMRSDLGR